MNELAQPPGEPVEGGTADGSGSDQQQRHAVEPLSPESPPVTGPVGGGADSDLHDTAAGDGWVPA